MQYKINRKLYLTSAGIILLAAAACITGIVLIGKPTTNALAALDVGLCMVSGPCLIAFAIQLMILFSKRPPLSLSEHGLIDHCPGSSAGTVSWHNVHKIEGFTKRGHQYLAIGVTDPQPLIQQQAFNQRTAFERKLQRNKDHVIIWLKQLNGDPDEIFEAVKNTWKESTGRTERV